MEKTLKFEQSTSASFYDKTKKPLVGQFQKFQPIKSNFPDLVQAIEDMNDRTCILQRQEQINLIRKKFRKCEQNITKISEMQELKALIEKTQLQLNQTRQKVLQQNSLVKEQIQNMLTGLERQLQNYKKQWERLRLKCENELTEQIIQVKTQKQTNSAMLLNLMKTTGSTVKQQISLFTQELKQCRKNRNNQTSKILGHLDAVRNNLNQLVDKEVGKRAEYDDIIYGLLEKTCENAQTALRRRVY